jgi:hypothetical protein
MRINTADRRAPMIRAGMNSCSRHLTGSTQIGSKPMGGIQCHQMAMKVMITVASQKSGKERPIMAHSLPI